MWLGLAIGNSRVRWGLFSGEALRASHCSGHFNAPITDHDSLAACLPAAWCEHLPAQPPLYVASVVAHQAPYWQAYPHARAIALAQVPLRGTYPQLGLDRALSLWGAGEVWGWPTLVVDAGTALALTAADGHCRLIGGAVLPGLRAQQRALAQQTDALPETSRLQDLPPRWARDTETAIASGILHTVSAGLQSYLADWWQQSPGATALLTGGDAALLYGALQAQAPTLAERLRCDPHLIFWGMRSVRAHQPGG
ncbi:MAG: pantothenate kinase [Cyanobacteria bacterium QS_8_64_29]|nr:MAG: pantothenate kinase [Cyanobacteria bacterium QS_8_64_29]